MLSVLTRLNAATIALFAVLAVGAITPPAVAETSIREVSAHAGGAGQWPANSARAFRESVSAGYYMIESDVHFTKDRIGVMVHDDKLSRECTKPGATIHSMTYAQVQQIRCNAEPIPALSEAISIIRGSSTILNLDVKTYSGQSTSSKTTYAALATRALVDGGMAGQATMQTFAWETMLPVIRAIAPRMEVTALESAPSLSRVRKAAAAGIDRYAMNAKDANEFFLRYAKDHGMKVGLWSLTTKSDVLYALDMGMNPISSDRPDEAVRFLASTEAAAPARRLQVIGRSPYTVSSATYTTGKVHNASVIGKAVPDAKVKALHAVILSIKVTERTGGGLIDVYPKGSRQGVDGVRIPIPLGQEAMEVRVAPGDSGKVSIVTTAPSAKLSVKVIGYENLAYDMDVQTTRHT